MQRKRNILPAIILAILLCNSNLSWSYSGPDIESALNPEETTGTISLEASLRNYTQSDPIVVIGNDNFAANGFSGNGTLQSPYLLEYLNITTETDTAIRIINTTRPFVIRSSLVTTQSDDLDFGIFFENVTNGKIESSIISQFSRSGLYLRSCWDITIDGCLFTNCRSAIETWGVWSLTLFNNNIIDSQSYAGLFEMIHDSTISNNTLIRNKVGFGISGSSNVSIEANAFVNGSGGVHYGETRDLVVRNNDFTNLSGSAVISTSMIQGYASPDEESFEFRIKNYIENNSFNNCSIAFYSDIGYYTQFSNNSVNNCTLGVLLIWSAGNYILDNEFRNSKEYGIHCLDTHLNRIYGNLFVNSGISNALDDEEGYNYWDDGQSIGNTWDDYIGPGGYRIPGDSVSIDRWPSRFGLPYISIVNETQVIVGTVGANVTWRAFDSDPCSYTIYQNGTVISNGIWNGSNIVMALDGLEVGVHNITAMVYDQEGHVASATVFVEVLPIPLLFYFSIISGVLVLFVLVVLIFQKLSISKSKNGIPNTFQTKNFYGQTQESLH